MFNYVYYISVLFYVYIYKASCNTSIICKYFYSQTLKNELTNSGNFVQVGDSDTVDSGSYDVVDIERDTNEKTLQYMKKNKIYIPNKNIKFPYLYWTPKLHKKPVGSRFITSSRGTTTSQLSVYVGSALKTLLKTDKIFHVMIINIRITVTIL